MIQFSEMIPADYDDVIAFWKAQPGIGLNESDGRRQIGDYLARNPGMSLLARDGNQIIGAVLCGHEGRRGYLHHLAVATSHRGRGIGRTLVLLCLEKLGACGIAKCNIFVYAANADGLGFWRALDFAERDDLKVLQRNTILPASKSALAASDPKTIVETPRLILRDFIDGDLPAVQAYASDVEVTRYMDWGPNTEAQTIEYLQRQKALATESPRKSFELAVTLKTGGTLIGGCGLRVNASGHEGNIGYVYERSHRGLGYAAEAAAGMLTFGFETLGLHRIFCTADVRNRASWHIMEKLGMQREGLLREHEMFKGEWRDSYVYGILDREWKSA